MADGAIDILADARTEAYSTPLDKIDVSQSRRFQDYTFWPFFERLRQEDPVHFCAESDYGPYWSITKYADIMQVDTSHDRFSSEGGITIVTPPEDFALPMFIAMDPPKHDAQRKVVSPIVSPANLANMEGLIRSRAARDSGQTSYRRDLRLGGSGVHRTNHPDAGDLVRLPLRGTPQTDLLVGHRHGSSGNRHRAH